MIALPPTRRPQQEGFLLLGVLFMILLILMTLALAAPKMAEEVRRDKEIETMHRGLQYARGIRMFYTKFGRYPNNMDQLMNTENQRFLRKRYLDPMTGKDDWRIIHLGEAKVAAVGLFGQSVQSNTLTPTGATGTNGTSSSFGGGSSSFGGNSSSFGGGNSSSSSSAFGGSGGSIFGNNGTTTTSPSTTGGTTTGGTTTGGTDTDSGSGFGSSTPIGGTTTTGQTSGSAFGSPGVTVGGAPIVGVGLLSKKESIKVYKKQTHYNQWEFVFDPNQSALEATSGAGTNLNGAGNGAGVNGGNGSGFGNSNGSGFGSSNGSGFGSSNGSGFGNSGGSGFGGSPTSPTSPTSPVNNSPQ